MAKLASWVIFEDEVFELMKKSKIEIEVLVSPKMIARLFAHEQRPLFLFDSPGGPTQRRMSSSTVGNL